MHLRRRNETKVSKRARPVRDVVADLERSKELRERIFARAPIIVPVALVVFTILKVLLVSQGNAITALTLLRSVGTVQVLEAGLLLGVPFLALSFFGLMHLADDSATFTPNQRSWIWLAYLVLVLTTSSVLYWFTTLVFVFTPILAKVFLWFKSHKASQRISDSQTSYWPTEDLNDIELRNLKEKYADLESFPLNGEGGNPDLVRSNETLERWMEFLAAWNARLASIQSSTRHSVDIVILWALLAAMAPWLPQLLNSTPWLPSERIVTNTGVSTGYILSTTRDWTTILLDSSRHIVIVPTESVTGQSLCRASVFPTQPVTIFQEFGLQKSIANYPAC